MRMDKEPVQPRNDPVNEEEDTEGDDDETELAVGEDEVEVIYEDGLEDEIANNMDNLDLENVSDEEDDIVPETDHATITFRAHQGPVYSCEFHPKGRICATGGEDEMLYVFDSLTTEIFLEEKFQDSVTLIKFNHDGKYLAAADMLGNLICWKNSNNSFTKVRTLKLNSPSWMEWHRLANVLVVAEKVYFCMWKVPQFDTVKYFPLDCYSETGCLMPDGKSALIGYDEGYAVILDLATFTVTSKLKQNDMNCEHGIVSVDAHPNNNVVALGTKKGRVILFTTKKPKVIEMIDMPTVSDGEFIESVKFGRDVLIGSLLVAFSNYLHIYDQAKLILRHKITLSGHAVKLVFIDPFAYIATSKAVVDVCNCNAGVKNYSIQGHTKAIMDMALSKDECRLITGSDDRSVKIFDLAPIASIVAATGENSAAT
ncbi:hypothetical protein O3M35_005823 [Rhynocoris fuscipes]|uniref:Angio-associated migratory cell protein n=1 Tax=Rhynocoris fuscipes TaxID=488301 RepID=A0AAW1DND6_9HEMI